VRIMAFDGDRLSELRNDKGLTQDELESIILKGKGSVSRYEKGARQADYETLVKLADYFDVSVDYLLGRTKRRRPWKEPPRHVVVDDLPEADAAKVEEYAALLRAERAKGK
jgi:transcriptional regulator with XRE-family HTH domain